MQTFCRSIWEVAKQVLACQEVLFKVTCTQKWANSSENNSSLLKHTNWDYLNLTQISWLFPSFSLERRTKNQCFLLCDGILKYHTLSNLLFDTLSRILNVTLCCSLTENGLHSFPVIFWVLFQFSHSLCSMASQMAQACLGYHQGVITALLIWTLQYLHMCVTTVYASWGFFSVLRV